MCSDRRKSTKLHDLLASKLLQAENLVAALVKNLESNHLFNVTQIHNSLDAITSNNHQISITMQQISTMLLNVEPKKADTCPTPELPTALPKHFEIRNWLLAWPQIDELVRTQVPATKRALFRDTKAANDITVSQLSAYDSAFDYLRGKFNTESQDCKAKEHGCFADISFPNSVFLENIHAAYRILLAQGVASQSQFIDVGCGSGLKVMQASLFFNRVVGLEYDLGYANIARELLEQVHIANWDVIHGDGITFDTYRDFNLVYFYRPMRDPAMLNKLENQIANTVEPETILFAPYEQFYFRHKELNCAPLGGSLYLAKSNQSQADSLRTKAEYTGTFFNKPRNTPPSIWDPIIKFSHKNGFGLDN
ncbi:MAG: class I SAM-dependent methyltransferase [Paraglaciecola sp.]|uniref:class I SAM-dependent methyltransferase n=1 Tax=Paraglaciecola sp. TaxID=1920173 RepID=UPI00329952D5